MHFWLALINKFSSDCKNLTVCSLALVFIGTQFHSWVSIIIPVELMKAINFIFNMHFWFKNATGLFSQNHARELSCAFGSFWVKFTSWLVIIRTPDFALWWNTSMPITNIRWSYKFRGHVSKLLLPLRCILYCVLHSVPSTCHMKIHAVMAAVIYRKHWNLLLIWLIYKHFKNEQCWCHFSLEKCLHIFFWIFCYQRLIERWALASIDASTGVK